jgi:hypothetical protein
MTSVLVDGKQRYSSSHWSVPANAMTARETRTRTGRKGRPPQQWMFISSGPFTVFRSSNFLTKVSKERLATYEGLCAL